MKLFIDQVGILFFYLQQPTYRYRLLNQNMYGQLQCSDILLHNRQ